MERVQNLADIDADASCGKPAAAAAALNGFKPQQLLAMRSGPLVGSKPWTKRTLDLGSQRLRLLPATEMIDKVFIQSLQLAFLIKSLN